jgi:hypothetical protein
MHEPCRWSQSRERASLLLGLTGWRRVCLTDCPRARWVAAFLPVFVMTTRCEDREVLMGVHPRAFFFTDHYRDSPAMLIRLAEIPIALLAT